MPKSIPVFKTPSSLPTTFRVKWKHLMRHKHWPQLNCVHHSLLLRASDHLHQLERQIIGFRAALIHYWCAILVYTSIPPLPRKRSLSSSSNLVNLTYLLCEVFPVLFPPTIAFLLHTGVLYKDFNTPVTLKLSAQTEASPR